MDMTNNLRFKPDRRLIGMYISAVEKNSVITSYEEWATLVNRHYGANITADDVQDYYAGARAIEEAQYEEYCQKELNKDLVYYE